MTHAPGAAGSSLLRLRGLTVTAPDGSRLLDSVDWAVHPGERWVVLGANGAGKSTLLHAAARHASVDTVGLATELAIPGAERAIDAVLTASYALLCRGAESYDVVDEHRAHRLLAQLGCRALAPRTFGSLSAGERQRVLIARSLMTDPELLLLDEPAAGLDLAGREALLHWLSRLAADPTAPATVLVTHHVEEIPAGTTHALLLRRGAAVASGPDRRHADQPRALGMLRPAHRGQRRLRSLRRPLRLGRLSSPISCAPLHVFLGSYVAKPARKAYRTGRRLEAECHLVVVDHRICRAVRGWGCRPVAFVLAIHRLLRNERGGRVVLGKPRRLMRVSLVGLGRRL